MNLNLIDIGKLQESLFAKLDIFIKEGVSLFDIDDFVESFFIEKFIIPIESTQPVTINLNNVVYHGRPTGVKLKNGDIVTIDICFNWNKENIDGAKTYIIGEVEANVKELLDVSRGAINAVVGIIDIGTSVKDVISCLSDYIGIRGYYLFPSGLGHGIGLSLHERPFMSLNDFSDFNYLFKIGDLFTIEPIVMLFKEDVVQNVIGEGIVGLDNLSSQFEITIYIRGKGDIIILNNALIN